MSTVDNLVANLDKVAYTSYLNADKIAVYSTPDDSSGIGINANMVAVAPSVIPDIQLTKSSTTNPYGRRCLMTMSWSLDRLNWYPQNVPIFYFNAPHLLYLWQAMAFAFCSDSTIYFGVNSQYTSDQIVYFQFALDSPD